MNRWEGAEGALGEEASRESQMLCTAGIGRNIISVKLSSMLDVTKLTGSLISYW